MKQLLPCVLLVLSSSAYVHAQTAANPYNFPVDSKNLAKGIVINIDFQGRTELYRGDKDGPFQAITPRILPRKVTFSIPFLGISNTTMDLSKPNDGKAPDAIYDSVKAALDSIQQQLLLVDDASSLRSSMTPEKNSNDEIIAYHFSRAGFQWLKSSENETLRRELKSRFSAFESYFNNLLLQKGYALDLDHIGIGDTRKVDPNTADTLKGLDGVVGLIVRGEKIDGSDDYQWRQNIDQYTLKVEIRLKSLTQ